MISMSLARHRQNRPHTTLITSWYGQLSLASCYNFLRLESKSRTEQKMTRVKLEFERKCKTEVPVSYPPPPRICPSPTPLAQKLLPGMSARLNVYTETGTQKANHLYYTSMNTYRSGSKHLSIIQGVEIRTHWNRTLVSINRWLEEIVGRWHDDGGTKKR